MLGDPVFAQQNPDGAPNLIVRAQPLHSRRSPDTEGARLAREILYTAGDSGLLLVLGVGAGYAVQALDALAPEKRGEQVFFFEPLDHARGQHAESVGGVVSSSHGILNTLDGATQLLQKEAKVYVLPQWQRLFPELAKLFVESLTDPQAATRRHFFRNWSRNFFARMRAPGKLAFLKRAAATLYDDVIYCGAGPGLFSDLALLNELLNEPKTLIAAADTALAPLLSAGVEPDLILSVDSGRGTAYHFLAAQRLADLPIEIPVLSWCAGSPALESLATTLCFYRSSFPFDQLLGTGPLADVPEFANPSGNAAGVALIAAEAARARNVHLAGVDFRTVDGDSHARGTGYDTFANMYSNRLRPAESYRRRGYSGEVTPALRRSLALLEARSAATGINLKSPRGESAASSKRDTPEPRKRQGSLTLPLVTVPATELARFLDDHGHLLPLPDLPDGGRTARRLLSL